MTDSAEGSNVYCTLDTNLPRRDVAELFRPVGAVIRKCGWDDFEVRWPGAEFVIESERPILMHGKIVDVAVNLEKLLTPLRCAGVPFVTECYDDTMKLLKVVTWPR